MVSTSIVVPVYNDPAGVRVTLQSLVHQTAEDYEVIVADNGSTDGTREVALSFTAVHDRVRLVIEDTIQSSYAARNRGIEHARGDVICFLDADMWVEPTYVRQARAAILEQGHHYVGCRVLLTGGEDSPVGRYNRAFAFPVEEYLSEDRFAPTCCLVVSSDLIDTVGTFDAGLRSGGDVEFGHRVADAGFSLHWAPDITVYHPSREGLAEHLRKRVRTGRGIRSLNDRHPTRGVDRHRLDPRNVLPPRPIGFLQRCRGADASLADLPRWYLLEWASKIAATYGRLTG